jgi:hypothetical protein
VVDYDLDARMGHDPRLRWRVDTKGMPSPLVPVGQTLQVPTHPSTILAPVWPHAVKLASFHRYHPLPSLSRAS